jgi:protein TonB
VGGLAIVGPAPPPPAAPPPERSREERIQELLAAAEGSPRVHTTYLFLSNLTAQSSSWLLRFIEREPGNPAASEAGQGQGFTAPVVVQKVDPCYPSDAYTERVEGTVLLYGVIGADGTVEDVTVVRSTEERLAERAKDAFARSRFRPARRQGRPIAVDVLVEIPFRLALCF